MMEHFECDQRERDGVEDIEKDLEKEDIEKEDIEMEYIEKEDIEKDILLYREREGHVLL